MMSSCSEQAQIQAVQAQEWQTINQIFTHGTNGTDPKFGWSNNNLLQNSNSTFTEAQAYEFLAEFVIANNWDKKINQTEFQITYNDFKGSDDDVKADMLKPLIDKVVNNQIN